MALVDYSSSDDNSDSEPSTTAASNPRPQALSESDQPVKKRKTKHTLNPASSDTASAALPPLPSAFHDLYASTVRISTVDDPNLHQGRKRQIPHVVGNWPTHLYIEWHPNSAEHEILTTLLKKLESRISSSTDVADNDVNVSTFLTSELGVPLPLHVSLSRPVAVSTAQKDAFLDKLRDRVKTSEIAPFELAPTALEWHRTHESARSFLVLRVGSASASRHSGVESKSEPEDAGNKELTALVKRCNGVVTAFDQPALYAFKTGGDARLGDAFHVSIAWSFADPTSELRRLTEEVFSGDECCDDVKKMRIRVDGVKAKIGNIVTHLSLPRPGAGGLFGL